LLRSLSGTSSQRKNGPGASPDPKGPSEAVKKLASAVSKFAEQYLGEPRHPRAPKIIHDAIWGTQRLYENEVAILDTPLLQRLRQIHQTGFTFLTFPSVTHTRFDHTLGVLYQADRLAKSLLDKYLERNDNTIVDLQSIRRLRVAALLHDCSHGPFSHTSEEYYKTFPEIEEYKAANKQQFEGASASEVLAHLILTSEPFKGFLHKLEVETALDLKADWLAQMITGQLKTSMTGHYQLILNGPFDADKLDYIFRDGHYSGLPLGVDLDRLYLKTEIHVINQQNIPKQSPTFTGEMRRLVMARPGINSLEQIVAARMNLTASLYHHHKIRACDCMLKGLFLFCRENEEELCGRRIETAADFLHLTDFKILGGADNAKGAVGEMLGNIVNRRLYKRALVLSMNSFVRPESEEETEIGEKRELNRVDKLIQLPFSDQRKLAEKIWLAAGRPGRKEEVWLDFPREPKTKDLADTFVNVGSIDKPVFRTLEQFIPIDQWQKQYLQQKWRGHVFCQEEHLAKITPAAVDVLGKEYKIKFTEFAYTHANLTPPTPTRTLPRKSVKKSKARS
jgi:HD superfamily phosphohydrolase